MTNPKPYSIYLQNYDYLFGPEQSESYQKYNIFIVFTLFL